MAPVPFVQVPLAQLQEKPFLQARLAKLPFQLTVSPDSDDAANS
jgi:hypothetical protein